MYKEENNIIEILKIIFAGCILLLCIWLMATEYLDQIIMLLTLFGLMINHLGKENILYKIREFAGEIFLFCIKIVIWLIEKFSIFYFLMFILIPPILALLNYFNIDDYFTKEIMSFFRVNIFLYTYLILIAIFGLLWGISYAIKSYLSKDDIDNKKTYISYYAFLFIIYSINMMLKKLVTLVFNGG